MALIDYDVLDTPIMEQTKFGSDMVRWLPNIVDSINSNFTSVNNIFDNIIAISSIDVGGSGAGPINVSVPGLSTSCYVMVTLLSSTNSVSISSTVAGTNQFAITFSADPGASAIITYQAYISQPQ